ncbi:hypothetical protein ACFDTO_28975 [Microbacteriaceae bacterium 4G12]
MEKADSSDVGHSVGAADRSEHRHVPLGVPDVGTEKKDLAAFLLIDQRGRPLDPWTARLVAKVLKRTSIVMPTSEYDPPDRFAKYNFPANPVVRPVLEHRCPTSVEFSLFNRATVKLPGCCARSLGPCLFLTLGPV